MARGQDEVSTGSSSDRVRPNSLASPERGDPVATAPGSDFILASGHLSMLLSPHFLSAMFKYYDLHFRPLDYRADLFAD